MGGWLATETSRGVRDLSLCCFYEVTISRRGTIHVCRNTRTVSIAVVCVSMACCGLCRPALEHVFVISLRPELATLGSWLRLPLPLFANLRGCSRIPAKTCTCTRSFVVVHRKYFTLMWRELSGLSGLRDKCLLLVVVFLTGWVRVSQRVSGRESMLWSCRPIRVEQIEVVLFSTSHCFSIVRNFLQKIWN